MKGKQFLMVILIAFGGGIIGGLFSDIKHFLFLSDNKIIEAQEFRLVDEHNNVWSYLKIDDSYKDGNSTGSVFVLYGPKLDDNGSIYKDKFGNCVPSDDSGNVLVIRSEALKSYVKINNPGTNHKTYLDRNGFHISDGNYCRSKLEKDRFYLSDENGMSRIEIGKVHLINNKSGEEFTTPLNTIYLFDKDGKYIEKFPSARAIVDGIEFTKP